MKAALSCAILSVALSLLCCVNAASVDFTFDTCISPALKVRGGVRSAICGAEGSDAVAFRGDDKRYVETRFYYMPTGGTVSFAHKLGSDSSTSGCENTDRGEGVVLEINRYSSRTENDIGWVAVWNSNSNQTKYKGSMQQVSVSIPASNEYDKVQMRWRQLDDDGKGYDAWSLDSITITGEHQVYP